jgi:uncharacterized membrane protein YtjA (UPF0391 family)
MTLRFPVFIVPCRSACLQGNGIASSCVLSKVTQNRTFHMLGWTLTFLVIAIIAGVLGFGGIAVASAGIAKILFLVFLVLFAASLIMGLLRRA